VQALIEVAISTAFSFSFFLTANNLRKRKIIIVDRCYLYKRDGETVDHLLLHCDVASTLWNHVFSRFGMSWVIPRRVVDLFSCWWKAGRSRSAAVWKMVPICILWCVWKERNLRCFEDLENSMENIVASFLHLLYLWTIVKGCRTSNISVHQLQFQKGPFFFGQSN